MSGELYDSRNPVVPVVVRDYARFTTEEEFKVEAERLHVVMKGMMVEVRSHPRGVALHLLVARVKAARRQAKDLRKALKAFARSHPE